MLASISRLERDLLSSAQLELVGRAREAMAIYRKNQDLINIGAYPAGSNPAIDQAIHWQEALQKFLRQPAQQAATETESWSLLEKAMIPPKPAKPKVKEN